MYEKIAARFPERLHTGAYDWVSQNLTGYIKEKYHMEPAASSLEKIRKTAANPAAHPSEFVVKGRDLQSGVPQEILLTAEEIRRVIFGRD